VIGANTGGTKSVCALNLAYQAATQGLTVGMFSLEMTSDDNVDRLCAMQGKIYNGKFREVINESDIANIETSMEAFKDLPIYFNPSTFKLGDVLAEIYNMASMKDAKFFIVDYAQQINDQDSKGYELVKKMMAGFKELAKELGIIIVVCAQLNRDALQEKEPEVYHFREGADFEQYADNVILLWREDDAAENTLCHFKVAKNRQGKTGKTTMKFIGDYQRYSEMSGGYVD
jgi:replicative DNA helicase